MAFGTDLLENGIGAITKIVEEWYTKCDEENVPELHARLIDFNSEIRKLKQDLGLNKDQGIGL